MPAEIKPKSEKQLKKALELVEWKLSKKKPCPCSICAINVTFYVAVKDALCLALGRKTVRLSAVLRALKKSHDKETKHQAAHAE